MEWCRLNEYDLLKISIKEWQRCIEAAIFIQTVFLFHLHRNDLKKTNLLFCVPQEIVKMLASILLKGYQSFEEILEKEGEVFLFSCWNSKDWEVRLEVANHQNFLPTLEQILIGMNSISRCKGSILFSKRRIGWFNGIFYFRK